MAGNPKEKKRKFVVPKAPRVGASKSSSARGKERVREMSVPDSEQEDMPSSGKYVVPQRTYPTPQPTVRKSSSQAEPSKFRQNRVRAPDFEAASTPRSFSRPTLGPDSSDSDDVVITGQNSPAKKKRKSTLRDSMGDRAANTGTGAISKVNEGKGKSKDPLELGLDSGEDLNIEEGSDEDVLNLEGSSDEESNKESSHSGAGKLSRAKDSRALFGPAASQAGPSTKEAGTSGGSQIVLAYNKRALGVCVRKAMQDMCGLDKAQDASQLVPQFNKSNRPIHFVDGKLVPHFSRLFRDEWNDWGGALLKLVRDRTRMTPEEEAVVNAATDNDIREACRIGVWATSKTAWMKFQNGGGEIWLQGKRTKSAGLGRKGKKAKHRSNALGASGLDNDSFKCVCDPNLQSDEEDDPSCEGRRIVRVPEYRSDEFNKLVVALDVAYNGNKSRKGNQKVTGYDYVKVNVSVPKPKSGDIPRWAISQSWEDANPELELESRQYIDPDKTSVPQVAKFQAFLHRYAPRKEFQREYRDNTSVAAPAPSTSSPAIDPDPEPEPEPVTLATADKSPPNPTPAPAVEHPPPPACELMTGIYGPSGPAPAPSEPLTPILRPSYTEVAQPPPEPSSQTTTGPPPLQPAFTQYATTLQRPQEVSHAPNAAGQFVRVMTAEGYWVDAWIPLHVNQAPLRFEASTTFQGGGHGVGGDARAEFQIDPSLVGQSIQPHQNPPMPPPPVLVDPAPEPHLEESVLPGKRGGRAAGRKTSKRGVGARTTRKSRKSKEVIDTGEDDVESPGEASTARSPQRPSNARNAKSVLLVVRGA